MAELLGRQYILDFCVSECSAKNRDKAYRVYMSDLLKLLAEGYYSAHGGNLSIERLYDQIYAPKTPEETMTEKELVSSIKQKLLAGGDG